MTFGYLYTIETDAWKAVGDEFGFDVQIFRQRMAEDFMTFGLLEIKDEMMRKVAFTKEGMTKVCESKKMNSSELKTIETQMAKYREILIKAENQDYLAFLLSDFRRATCFFSFLGQVLNPVL